MPLDRVDAVIFDVDGVITDTASVHAAAWRRMFDAFLASRARRTDEAFVPFDAEEDYRQFVDGKPRYDGVRSFLASRGIVLPEGDPTDPSDRETVCGLGSRKNELFLEQLREHGAEPYRSTTELVRELVRRGVGVAAVSASRNMSEVLEAAGVAELFPVRVDGVIADELRLPGKPHPAAFLEAARRLDVEPSRAAVVEDARSGVEAAARGGFAFVIGVDRTGDGDALRTAGADIVVPDLAELEVESDVGSAPSSIRTLPLALDHAEAVARRIGGRRPAVFLDYDGTLTPIVERPEAATLSSASRRSIRAFAARFPVAVVSGRDLADVRAMVDVDGIAYAGSHGFDLMHPDGRAEQLAVDFLPDLDAAERELAPRLEQVPGARLERKRFAIAIHERQVDDDRLTDVEAAVSAVAVTHPRLRRTGGKKVVELRPAIDWDKGKAVLWLLETLRMDDAAHVPIYVGDDETDEDAFQAIREVGLGVVVRGEGDDRTTFARFALRDPDEVLAFLRLIADAAGGERGP
jgi:alpha,alpha-trehalase